MKLEAPINCLNYCSGVSDLSLKKPKYRAFAQTNFPAKKDFLLPLYNSTGFFPIFRVARTGSNRAGS